MGLDISADFVIGVPAKDVIEEKEIKVTREIFDEQTGKLRGTKDFISYEYRWQGQVIEEIDYFEEYTGLTIFSKGEEYHGRLSKNAIVGKSIASLYREPQDMQIVVPDDRIAATKKEVKLILGVEPKCYICISASY